MHDWAGIEALGAERREELVREAERRRLVGELRRVRRGARRGDPAAGGRRRFSGPLGIVGGPFAGLVRRGR